MPQVSLINSKDATGISVFHSVTIFIYCPYGESNMLPDVL